MCVYTLTFLLLSIFCNSVARFTVGDSDHEMIGAMNLEIQNLKSKNNELMESKLRAVRKKSDYKEKCEQLEAELKAVRKEKSDYEEKCEQQETELKAVHKKKSEYEEKCEQQETELKAVRKEKSNYEEKCVQQEAELKAVRKEKLNFEEKCEQQETEAKKVEKRTLKKSEVLEREKKTLVLQEESKDHIDAIMAGSSVTDIKLDIVTFDGELHYSNICLVCNVCLILFVSQ